MESPPSISAPPPERSRFAVLLFTDIVGSTDMKARHGVPAYSEALRIHNGHFERLAHECLNLRTLQSRGDGYFAEAGGVAEAVRFALLFEQAMREGPWGEVRLTARVGIHAGEVGALNAEDGTWIVGLAADLASRVADLALGGQILLTRFPFDEARHFIREHPPVAGKTMPPLRWLAHGPYLMKGREEPMEIFEVGAEGFAPLVAPPDCEKAKRAIRPGEEETLGWRPAVGLEIPGRTGWHLTERLGAGGFGEVWVGEHAKLRERRAFKFCFDDERLRALKREVTLVRLLRSALGERDDIVHIHELKLDAPPFYLESDLAPHGNLLQWAERQGGLDKIPLAQRIALVAHTATALAAAHSIGVLHKDIKPTNILIFDGPDGEPRPRLVDFGIGTLADPAVLGEFGVTGAGFTQATTRHSTGTPTYSPPEYLAGRPYTIQGDIYGLGVLLYQLVTVKPLDPLAPGWERDIEDPLLREDIAECVDGDPSRRLPSAADLTERLLHLDQRRAEIAWKERLTREAAAHSEAEAAATAARLRASRFRKLAAAFATLALLAIAGGVLARMNQQKAASALGEVEAKKTEVDRKNTEQRAMLVEAARSDRLIAEEKLRTGKEREAFVHLARACEYDPPSTLAAEKAVVALNNWNRPPVAILGGEHLEFMDSSSMGGPDLSNVQFSPDGKRIVTAMRNKTARVWDVATGRTIATLAGHEGDVLSAQFSPEGTRVVTGSDDKTARVWDAATGKTLAILAGYKESVSSAQYSPDGARIVTVSGDKTAWVWDAATGKTLAILAGHEGPVSSAQFSPDGSRIVTGSADKTARVWDAATGKTIATLVGNKGEVSSAQFSPDGSRIITTSWDGRVWDAATGKAIGTPFINISSGGYDRCGNVQFSPDGKRIVSPSWDSESDKSVAHVRDATTGEIFVTFKEHGADVSTARFSPDGTRIVTASDDKTARIWDAATGKTLAILAGHEGRVSSAQFSPDGSRIVTVADDEPHGWGSVPVSEDKTVRVWDAVIERVPGDLANSIKSRDGTPRIAARSPDGKRVFTTSDKTAQVWDPATGKIIATVDDILDPPPLAEVWDTATGKIIATLAGYEGSVLKSAEFSPDGKCVVTAPRYKAARVWDATTGESLATLAGHEGTVWSVQFSPDGKRIVTASDNKTARLWDSNTGKPVGEPMRHEDFIHSVQYNPDGWRIVTTSRDKTARLWDSNTGKPVGEPMRHEDFIHSVQFSPDGLRIVTTSQDKIARIWDAATGKAIATLAGHGGAVSSAQFSPDGKRAVTASRDNTARVWDAETGVTIAILAGHEMRWGACEVLTAQFSPDGSCIVTGSDDNTARVWEAATGKCLFILAPHDDAFGQDPSVGCAQFSPDGSRIVTASSHNTVQLWDAATGKIVATIAVRDEMGEGYSHAQFSLDGSRIFTTGSHNTRIWSILPPTAGPPPEWFADFLRYMAQMRLNFDGELEPLKPDEWRALQEKMRAARRAGTEQDTPYLRILRRFVPE